MGLRMLDAGRPRFFAMAFFPSDSRSKGCGVGMGHPKPLALAALVGQQEDGVDYMASGK